MRSVDDKAEAQFAIFKAGDVSEDSLALSFAAANKNLRYVAQWARWLSWNSKQWQEDTTLEVFDRIRKHCRQS